MKTYLSPFLFAILLTTSQTAFAYLSLNETGELVKDGEYRVGLAPQLRLANGGGTNFSAFFDMYIKEDVNSRFEVGGGTTDFWTSASAKWVPYPDYDKQPAVGVKGAFIYARDNTSNLYNFQVTPLISKIFNSRWGKLTPYLGVPFTLVYSGSSVTATQLVIGSEWNAREDFQLGAELDLNLSRTTTALTFHINVPFDGETGFRK